MAKSSFITSSGTKNQMAAVKPAQRDQSLSELVDGVAHDLNNNIAVALGYVQLLKLKNKEGNVTEGLTRIEKSLFKCGEVIKALQEHSAQASLNLEATIDLQDVLLAALDIDETGWKEFVFSKKLNIKSAGAQNNIFVRGNKKDLVTAISHLIHNAVDASPRKGTVEIKVGSDKELAYVAVADKGKGIRESVKAKIYEPFFSTKKTKGSGLGLTIVQSIVSRSGGRIGFDDNHPAGTIFTVSFPMVAGADEVLIEEAGMVSGKRILIVDDDEEVRNVLHDMLGIEGFQSEVCSDATGAMELLEKGTFNLMITDLGMPGMSGYDLAEYVRDRYKEIEIVLMTGWGNSFKNDRKKISGVRAVIAKPFHLNEILQLVRR